MQQGLNTRQIDENVVFNLAATRPDLLTGVDPATGNPAPYGSVGVYINCAVIGLHRQGSDGQSRRSGSQLAVPSEVARVSS